MQHSSKSNLIYNWLTGFGGGGWAHHKTFEGFFSQDNLDSIKLLINNENPHIYTQDHYGAINFTAFKTLVIKSAQANPDNGIMLNFYVNFHFLGHNLYGAKWVWQ